MNAYHFPSYLGCMVFDDSMIRSAQDAAAFFVQKFDFREKLGDEFQPAV